MKKGGKKIFLITAVLVLVMAGFYKVGISIFAADQFHFSIDSQLSPEIHKAIKQAVFESYGNSFASLSQAIKNVCPALKQVNLERCSNRKLYVQVQAMNPYVCIGDTVLTDMNVVVEKRCFIPASLENLPVIHQKNMFAKATITDELKQWILRLDPSVFALYDVIWLDDFSIELHDKNKNYQTILCSVCSAPDQSIRELCQRIIDEKSSGAQGTARHFLYTADIRFEKQIIICSRKGGACNG